MNVFIGVEEESLESGGGIIMNDAHQQSQSVIAIYLTWQLLASKLVWSKCGIWKTWSGGYEYFFIL